MLSAVSGDSDAKVGDEIVVNDIVYKVVKEGDVKEVMVFSADKDITEYNGVDKVTSNGINYNVTSIGKKAFIDCMALKTVKIPKTVKDIGFSAFAGCISIRSLTIPDNVVSIHALTFNGCSGIITLTLPISLNAVANNDFPAFSGCTNIEKFVFTPGTGEGFDYGLGNDSTVNLYGWTPWFQTNKSNVKVVFEKGIRSIGDYAFYECTSLAPMKLPDSVKDIGENAFTGCSGAPAFVKMIYADNLVMSGWVMGPYNRGRMCDKV